MKLSYFSDTDTLYIELRGERGVEAQEVGEGVVADYDGDGQIVALEIEHASRRVDVRQLVTSGLPAATALAA